MPDVSRRLIELSAAQAAGAGHCSTEADYVTQLRELSAAYNRDPTLFTYADVSKMFRCMLRYNSRSGEPGSLPSLTAGVARLFNDIDRQPDFDTYQFYTLLFNGLGIAYIKTANTRVLTPKDVKLINESWIGLVYLNSLKAERDVSPYFKYIYCAYTCGQLAAELPNMAEACCGGLSTTVYSVQEQIVGPNLHKWLVTPGRAPQDITAVYIQLIKALVQAASHGVNTFNFRPIDVIVKEAPLAVTLSATQAFVARAYPVIVDFSDCQATGVTDRYNPTVVSGDDVMTLRQMFASALGRYPAGYQQFVAEYPAVNFASLNIPTPVLAALGGEVVVESTTTYQLGAA